LKPFVLIVEDDLDFSQIVEEILVSEAYEVAVAPNGLAGLHTIAKRRPDVIIVDLMMPMLSGIEMLRHLRRWSKIRRVPTIIATAMPETLRDEEDLPYDLVLAKPFRREVLVDAMLRMLALHMT